ncbi:hypothetical protein PMAYCL1PPCAC_32345, partial [Pristionchus mayeri]
SIEANTIHATFTVSAFNLFSAICYFFIIRKLLQLNKEHTGISGSRKWRREISLSIVGFFTVLALCLATCYFSVSYHALDNMSFFAILLSSIRDFNVVHIFAMAFVNPWMLLITNGSMRKK